ncbi:hypothetical protein NPIL_47971, partial [Nephila pilipes]
MLKTPVLVRSPKLSIIGRAAFEWKENTLKWKVLNPTSRE